VMEGVYLDSTKEKSARKEEEDKDLEV
jgi:hypothetical protein